MIHQGIQNNTSIIKRNQVNSMRKIGKYIKRGIKYIFTGHKQPIVKIDIVEKTPTNVFENKVYLITGGSSGIGLCISKKLVKHGAHVIITGRNEEKLKKAREDIGNNCEYIVCDISNIDESINKLRQLFEKSGHIDGLVNNAGISLHEWDFLKVTLDGYDSQFNTNLKGSFFLTQSYIEKLQEKKQNGNIVFISSEAGTMCDDLPYGLTKASINSLVQALSSNYYKNGIRVNAISPGVTVSEMTKINRAGDMYSDSNSGRFFLPEEVAEVVIFLLSDYSKCISGEVIHVNGGNHIKKRY